MCCPLCWIVLCSRDLWGFTKCPMKSSCCGHAKYRSPDNITYLRRRCTYSLGKRGSVLRRASTWRGWFCRCPTVNWMKAAHFTAPGQVKTEKSMTDGENNHTRKSAPLLLRAAAVWLDTLRNPPSAKYTTICFKRTKPGKIIYEITWSFSSRQGDGAVLHLFQPFEKQAVAVFPQTQM